MPPLGCLDHVCDSGRGGASLGLNLADWPEATSGEGLLELTGDTVIRMVVWPKPGEDDLPVLVPLLLGGNSSRRRGGTIQVVDIEIDDANLRRWADSISGLGWETNNVGARVIDVNFGVSGVNGRESNAVPAAKFNNVLDGHDGDLSVQWSAKQTEEEGRETCPKHSRMPRVEQNPTRGTEGDLDCDGECIGRESVGASTDLTNRQNVIYVQTLKKRPHGEVDVYQSSSEVQPTGEPGNNLETCLSSVVFGRSIQTDDFARSRSRERENLGDLESVGLDVFGKSSPGESEVVPHKVINWVSGDQGYPMPLVSQS